MQTVAAMYPSQYRKYLKLWKEHNVAAIHESGFQWLVKHAKRVGGSYKESNGIIYRVFFPIYVEASIPKEIVAVLEKAECSLDPESSYCIDKHGRRVSINKAYQSNAKRQGVAADEVKGVLEVYAEQLGSSGAMVLCVSRHPYDVAGMSTGRAWQSCHTIGGDTPREKNLKAKKYANDLITYENELSAYNDELSEFESRIMPLKEFNVAAGRDYRKAQQRLNSLEGDYAELEFFVLGAFIEAASSELFKLVFENTGVLEETALKKIALNAVKYTMDEDQARMYVRRALLEFAVPDKQYSELDYYVNAGVFGFDTYYDFYEKLCQHLEVHAGTGKIFVRKDVLEDFNDKTKGASYTIDLAALKANAAIVSRFYAKRTATLIPADKLEYAAKLVPELITAYERKEQTEDRYFASRNAISEAMHQKPVTPEKPTVEPKTQAGGYAHRVKQDVITGSVIAYVIKPKLNLLTSLERAKRVDVRMATALNARLDKSNKDPLFEPLGRIILRTANGKYLRPGALYGFSYNEKIRVQFEKMAKLLSVALNKATRRDSGGTEPLYHEYDPEVDKTYLEGEHFGFATTKPMDVQATPRARRNNQLQVLEDEPLDDELIVDEPLDDELIVDDRIGDD